MTSFSVIKNSGYQKMLGGVRLCRDEPGYLEFFGVGTNGQ
jgi:hypothetical protein